jgi:cytochrome b561
MPEPDLPRWQGAASGAAHAALYILVFAMVLSGWANAAAHNWPIALFWGIPLPALFPPAGWARDFGELHAAMVWILIAVAGLHIAAALAHHFILGDGVLRRMLPQGPARRAR